MGLDNLKCTRNIDVSMATTGRFYGAIENNGITEDLTDLLEASAVNQSVLLVFEYMVSSLNGQLDNIVKKINFVMFIIAATCNNVR